MAGPNEDEDDKPFEPTQKRLDDARKKGEVPHSTDLTTAAAFGGLLLSGSAFGASGLNDLGSTLAAFFWEAEYLSHLWFEGPLAPATSGVAQTLASSLSLWFAIPMLTALLAILAQRALVFAPEKLQPKLSRISPIQGAKNKYGRNGLFEFFKSSTKLVIVSTCLALFCIAELPQALASLAWEPGQVTAHFLGVALRFLGIIFITLLALGGIDFFWQQAEHLRKNRMSKKDMTDEQKDSEGDPYLKARRRNKAAEIASTRMMADVPKADVVIVNPTHFAVALKWDRSDAGAPTCVAKGVDDLALKIRRTAERAGVPVMHDPVTARVLYRMVELGDEILPEHYRAVAVAIRFADRVRGRSQVQS